MRWNFRLKQLPLKVPYSFVDFTKAYDRVDHNILLTKLKDRGVPHCLVKWFHSYLSFRCQTVRVDNQYSDWVYITAGMPQGSPLGLLSFLLLIDDLTVDCLTHKYVDDTTLTELLPRGSQQTHMKTFLQQLQTWATPNKMKINFMKTKEMILGLLAKFSPQHLSDSSANNPVIVERVQQFKLLGITISHDLNWQTHIDAIITKAFLVSFISSKS